jgi:hypothetical protein
MDWPACLPESTLSIQLERYPGLLPETFRQKQSGRKNKENRQEQEHGPVSFWKKNYKISQIKKIKKSDRGIKLFFF